MTVDCSLKKLITQVLLHLTVLYQLLLHNKMMSEFNNWLSHSSFTCCRENISFCVSCWSFWLSLSCSWCTFSASLCDVLREEDLEWSFIGKKIRLSFIQLLWMTISLGTRIFQKILILPFYWDPGKEWKVFLCRTLQHASCVFSLA